MKLCSSITTASSTISPTDAAIPPSVIMLKLMPSAYAQFGGIARLRTAERLVNLIALFCIPS
ncbi:MAG: hypothetical protein ACKVOJ_05010 [Sphingomonadaceae bacterium]